MEKKITKRIAIQNFDLLKIPLKSVYGIIERINLTDKFSIDKHVSTDGTVLLIVNFQKETDAKYFYDLCNDVAIENTNEHFNLCFIPDSMVFNNIVEKCDTAGDFNPEEPLVKLIESEIEEDEINDTKDEDEITEYNDEDEINDSKDEINDSNDEDENEKKQKKAKNEKKSNETINLKEKLEEEVEEDKLTDFVFNPKDPRFAKLYTDRDFRIDVSNKKFKAHPELFDVVKELRNYYNK